MIELSNTVAVNATAGVALTADDVWKGLVWKAENPMPFVPSITSCTVVERYDTGLVRDIIDAGDPIREHVRFEPPRRVFFERVGGRILGTIVNQIETDVQGRLVLRFSFALTVSGDDESEICSRMSTGYAEAVNTTLAAVRRSVT